MLTIFIVSANVLFTPPQIIHVLFTDRVTSQQQLMHFCSCACLRLSKRSETGDRHRVAIMRFNKVNVHHKVI